MKEHVILLITNRQEEDIIVRHIMSKCNITEEFNVWSYSASLMKLYNWIYDVDGKERALPSTMSIYKCFS